MNTHNSDNAGQPVDYLREGGVYLREKEVTLREGAVCLREKDATLREQEIQQAEATRVASDGHNLMLQQVNARLVIATIEAKELAEQLQTTKDQMEIAKSVAEKANRAKSEFLSNMSHELRTPLNAILGFAQLLETGLPSLTAVQKVRVNEIIKAGWYLLELINEILDLALVESGKLLLLVESVSLVDVLLECKTMIEPQAQKYGIKLTFVPCDNTWLVYADRTRVKQVMLNLLSNAIKYNRKQGTIEVKCTLNTPERIRIGIKDSGTGLSAEQMAQLFQSFNRLGQETGIEEGTGIGLVVSKQLVELMGGSIGAASTVGVGSEFWIEFIKDVNPQFTGGNAALVGHSPQADGNAALRTLLYIEDNAINLMLVEHIIDDFPHLRMISAPDANLGIAMARVHLPDVILMDINLPGINGFQALKILCEDTITAHIPVIALSGNVMPHDIERGLVMGFFGYLTKPIKVNEFMETLNEALKFSGAILNYAHKREQV